MVAIACCTSLVDNCCVKYNTHIPSAFLSGFPALSRPADECLLAKKVPQNEPFRKAHYRICCPSQNTSRS